MLLSHLSRGFRHTNSPKTFSLSLLDFSNTFSSSHEFLAKSLSSLFLSSVLPVFCHVVMSCSGYSWLFTADILTCHSRRSTGVTNSVNTSSIFHSKSLSIRHVNEHEQYQSPGMSALNAAIINVRYSTSAFRALTSQNVYSENGSLHKWNFQPWA